MAVQQPLHYAGRGSKERKLAAAVPVPELALLDFGQFARCRAELDGERLAVASRIEGISLPGAAHLLDALEAVARDDLAGLRARNRGRLLGGLSLGLSFHRRQGVGVAPVARGYVFRLVILRIKLILVFVIAIGGTITPEVAVIARLRHIFRTIVEIVVRIVRIISELPARAGVSTARESHRHGYQSRCDAPEPDQHGVNPSRRGSIDAPGTSFSIFVVVVVAATITTAAAIVAVGIIVIVVAATITPPANPVDVLDAAVARLERDPVHTVPADSAIAVFDTMAIDGTDPPKTYRGDDAPALTATNSPTSRQVVGAWIIWATKADADGDIRVGGARPTHRTDDDQAERHRPGDHHRF